MSHDRRDETPDEVAVTDVSDEVLQELSSLFGAQATRSDAGVDASADRTPPSGSGARDATVSSADVSAAALRGGVIGNVEDGDRAEEVLLIAHESDVVVIDDTRLAPLDPLLTSVPRSDIVGGHDDVGPVVIVDDEVDRVVIVDDDRPDPSFEDRQRRRARRERLRRIKWVKIVASSSLVVILLLAVLASPLFAIRSVDFEGAVYTSKASIDRAAKALKGESVFTVDTARAREVLLSDPWVADVRVTTHFPGRALVEVSERKPVVWYVGDDQKARVVDARGHIIAVLTGWPTKYLQVAGVGPSLKAGAIADDSYRAAAQLVIALPDEIRPKVKSLELTGGGELSMTLSGGTLIRFGPPTGLQDKLVAVVVLLRRQNPSTLAVIDVSTGEPTVQTR